MLEGPIALCTVQPASQCFMGVMTCMRNSHLPAWVSLAAKADQIGFLLY